MRCACLTPDDARDLELIECASSSPAAAMHVWHSLSSACATRAARLQARMHAEGASGVPSIRQLRRALSADRFEDAARTLKRAIRDARGALAARSRYHGALRIVQRRERPWTAVLRSEVVRRTVGEFVGSFQPQECLRLLRVVSALGSEARRFESDVAIWRAVSRIVIDARSGPNVRRSKCAAIFARRYNSLRAGAGRVEAMEGVACDAENCECAWLRHGHDDG